MESIIKSFSEHGTFVQPNSLEYILSKDNPKEFISFIQKKLKEFPFILTLDQIKNLEREESEKEIDDTPKILKENKLQEKKEQQTKLLSEIYHGKQQLKLTEEEELYFDEQDKELIQETALKNNDELSSSVLILENIKSWKPESMNYESEVKIIKDVTGNSTCEGTVKDFTKLFLDRFNTLRKILKKQRRELANAIPISRVKSSGLNDIQLIGIVKDVKNTTNGHRLIELEDDTDEITAIVLKNDRDLHLTSLEVILDEIIGVQGQLSKNGDLFVIKNIIFPDISIQNHRNKTDVPLCAAFLSDIHIGSNQFMQKEWNYFIRWLNGDIGNSRQRNVAGKIKYLVIPGDVVDGIGIYPDQEAELSITDVYQQYEVLADQLRFIPKHITIVMQPGNHDAVRPAEPQPTFEKEIRDLFTDMDIRFVGNPCYFSLHNVEILSYHGQSLLDFSTNIQHLKYNEPIEIMKRMLRKHHLSPTYGGYTPLAPEHFDYMVIDRIPDIFVTGHVHLATIGEYRGITLINASSWQSQTSDQKMLNFIPEPAKLPIVDLKSGNVTMMDFNKQL